jgi:hypothetical protein
MKKDNSTVVSGLHPRAYLSFTQLVMFEKSPETYKRVYIDGQKMGTNRGQALGKEIANSLENDAETGDPLKDLVLAQIPSYERRDQLMYIDFKTSGETIPLCIRPDSCKQDLSAIIEVKTGAEKSWSQKKVDESDQLTFYATGLYVETHKIPECELVWAITKKVVGEDGVERPELTGEVKRFRTIRRMSHVLKMMVRIRKAWVEIGKLFDKEII